MTDVEDGKDASPVVQLIDHAPTADAQAKPGPTDQPLYVQRRAVGIGGQLVDALAGTSRACARSMRASECNALAP
jgi:hypothetical protein